MEPVAFCTSFARLMFVLIVVSLDFSSGPASVVMSGVDSEVLNLSHLQEGHYVFKLTVTDMKGLTGTDMVTVNVKRGKRGNDIFKSSVRSSSS